MTDLSSTHAAKFRATLADVVSVPILLTWIVFSNGPLVSLASGGMAPMRLGMTVFFLLTSAWGVLGGYILLRMLMWESLSATSPIRVNRAYLAAYGGVWCVLYFVFLYMPR